MKTPPSRDRARARCRRPAGLPRRRAQGRGGHTGFPWAGGARSGEEALLAVRELKPEFVLLDVRMPGIDGIETARQICNDHPDILVVLISVEESPAMRPAIEASGAAEIVRKQEFGPAMLRRLWRTHSKAPPKGTGDRPRQRWCRLPAPNGPRAAADRRHPVLHVHEAVARRDLADRETLAVVAHLEPKVSVAAERRSRRSSASGACLDTFCSASMQQK